MELGSRSGPRCQSTKVLDTQVAAERQDVMSEFAEGSEADEDSRYNAYRWLQSVDSDFRIKLRVSDARERMESRKFNSPE